MATLLESGFAWLRGQLEEQSPRCAVTVEYTPPYCSPIEFEGLLISNDGGMEYSESGDVQKVVRAVAKVKTSCLIEKGVTELQRMAIVTIDEKVWAIDLPRSKWGPELVRLGLIRREISRHQEMESHGSV